MSDEATVVEQVVEPVVESTPVEPEITVDSFKQSALKRDKKAVTEQFNRLTGKTPKTETPVEATPEVSKEVSKEPPKEPQKEAPKEESKKNKYVVGDVELDDPDGFLGYRTQDELKKAAANQIRRIQMDKKWIQEAEMKAQAEQQRADAAEARLKELEAKASQPVEPKVDASVKASEISSQFKLDEMPTAPTPPDIPPNPNEWEEPDIEAEKDYRKAVSDYNASMAKWVESGLSKAAQHAEQLAKAGLATEASNPLIKDMAEIKKAIAEMQKVTTDVTRTKEELQIEGERSKYWNDIHDFQKAHPDLDTPVPLKELHKQIWEDGSNPTWMDYVARANGVVRPVGGDSKTWEQYFNNRLAITQKYLDGDQSVKTRCETAGVQEPQGCREYFKAAQELRNLDEEHRRLKEQGLLGPKSTRQMAWEYTNKDNLTTQIQSMEQKARATGASTVIDALTKHDVEHAVVLPPDSAQSGSTPLSEKRVAEMLQQTSERARDPEFRRMLAELTKRQK